MAGIPVIALSVATSKKFYHQFGTTLLDRVFDESVADERADDMRTRADEILSNLISEVGKKAPKPKKVKKTGESKSPSKGELKKQATISKLTQELASITGQPMDDSVSYSVGELREKIKTAKKAAKEAKKQADKAAKEAKKQAAKAAKEAKKQADKAAKEAKKQEAIQKKMTGLISEVEKLGGTVEDGETLASLRKKVTTLKKAAKSKAKKTKAPSKRELVKMQLLGQLSEMTTHEFTVASSTKEIRDAIAAEKKKLKAAQKAAVPKEDVYSERFTTGKDHDGFKNKAGKFWLRVKINKKTRAVTKTKPDTWTDEANAAFEKIYPDGVAVKKSPAKKTAKKTAKKPAKSQLDMIAQLATDAATAELAEENVIAVDDEELSVEELSEIEDSDEEEDEPEFPGEDAVEEFDHFSRVGEELYIDDEHNVYDAEQMYIGKYDSGSDTIVEP